MKAYRTFEEYMYDKYYDKIHFQINGFLCQKKSSAFLCTNIIPDVNRFELEDYHIMGVTYKSTGGDVLNFRLSINADVNVYGKSRYEYESDTKSIWLSVYCESILRNGLQNLKFLQVEEYSKEKYDKERNIDHYLVPYLYSDDADSIAEDFLRRHCPQALQIAMPLPIDEVVRNLGMQAYYAPLGNNIFGKTYFEASNVTVYTDNTCQETVEISVSPGTMLVNPNVFFINAPKYIRFNDEEHPEMTEYALDHVDECCFLFTCKKQIKLDYDDSYYRACFLCREVTADSLIEAEYESDKGKNKLTEKEAASIDEIVKLSKQFESDFDKLPGSFHKTVDYHIKRKGLTAEILSERSKISTQTISELRNKTDKPVKIDTLLKLFIGLNLNKEYCYDLMRKAGIDFPRTMEGRFFRWLVDEQTDENIERWQQYLDHAKINVKLCNLEEE